MKLFFVRWLLYSLLMPSIVFAQAVPSRMQLAVSGVVQSKMQSRGVAANDPKYAATLQAAGSTIAGAAASAAVITAAGVTAPAWVTAAVGTGLAIAFAAGINLAVDVAKKWFFGSDGSVRVDVTINGQGTNSNLQPGQPYSGYYDGVTNQNVYVSSLANAQQWWLLAQQEKGNKYDLRYCGPTGDGRTNCEAWAFYSDGNAYYAGFKPVFGFIGDPVWGGGACNGASIGGACVANYSGDTVQSVTYSPTNAVANLTEEEKAKPVNPQLIASIADTAWKNAASQPGYEGVPYDASNPITVSDANTWQQANPSSWPTVGDAVAPQAAPSGGTAATPFTLPNTAPSTGGNTGSDQQQPQQPTIDWTISGNGETIPQQVVPISYTPTLFAAPTGCPAPVSFSMFGKPYAISYGPFCDLMATLAPIFLAIGAAAAALIFAESLKS